MMDFNWDDLIADLLADNGSPTNAIMARFVATGIQDTFFSFLEDEFQRVNNAQEAAELQTAMTHAIVGLLGVAISFISDDVRLQRLLMDESLRIVAEMGPKYFAEAIN